MTVAIVKFPCREGKREELLGFLASEDGLAKTREFNGCNGIDTLTDNDENDLVLVQRWDSAEHHKAYVAWRVEGGMMEALEPILRAPLEITYLTETGV